MHPSYKRSVAISLVISVGNASGLAASQIYPASDGPRYIMGNAISLGAESLSLIGVGLIYLLLKYRMKQKNKLIAEGKESNGKEGDGALEFKYVF